MSDKFMKCIGGAHVFADTSEPCQCGRAVLAAGPDDDGAEIHYQVNDAVIVVNRTQARALDATLHDLRTLQGRVAHQAQEIAAWSSFCEALGQRLGCLPTVTNIAEKVRALTTPSASGGAPEWRGDDPLSSIGPLTQKRVRERMEAIVQEGSASGGAAASETEASDHQLSDLLEELHNLELAKQVLRATFDWLTDRVVEGRGAVTFCMTESGMIGVFVGAEEKSRGSGGRAEEAIALAMAHEPAASVPRLGTDPTIPPDEMHFQQDGRTVAKITGLGTEEGPMPAPLYAHVCGIPGKHGEQQQCQACEHDAEIEAARAAPEGAGGTPKANFARLRLDAENVLRWKEPVKGGPPMIDYIRRFANGLLILLREQAELAERGNRLQTQGEKAQELSTTAIEGLSAALRERDERIRALEYQLHKRGLAFRRILLSIGNATAESLIAQLDVAMYAAARAAQQEGT